MMLKLHGVEPGKDASGTMEMIAKDMFRRFPLKKWEKQALRELSLMPVQGISEDLYYQVSGMAPGAVERLEDRLLIRREEKEGKYVLSLHPIIAKAARDVFVPTQNTRSSVDSIRSRAIPGIGPIWKTRRSSRIYLLS